MSVDSETQPPPAPASRAVGAGRGLLYITGAKIWFMLGGSAISFVLPYLLSKASYGEWGVIASWLSPVNNVVVVATIQSVSRFASRGTHFVEATKRAALRLQALTGGVLALVFFLAAPLVARFEHDLGLTTGLRLAAGVILAYSFYAVFVGACNGAREFHRQAGLDAAFTALKALLVCGGALIFSSVVAAVGGFVLAAASVLLVAILVVGVRRRRESDASVSTGDLWRFMAPVALYLFVSNLLMFIDGWMVKRLVAEAAERARQLDPTRIASEAAAVYTVVQAIARIPYQAILAVTFVIFPLVSRAIFDADQGKTRDYIDRSLRLSFLIVMIPASAVAARAEGLLNFLPRGEYLAGAHALAVLAMGYVAYSLLTIAATILNSAGRTRATMTIGLVTLVLDAAATWLGIGYALTRGRDPLLWAAGATTGASLVGLVLALAYLQRSFGASLHPRVLGSAALSSALAILIGHLLPFPGRVGGLAVMVLAAFVYIGGLFATRAMTLGELKLLLRPSAR